MSRRTSKRVSFSPDVNERPTISLKNGGNGRSRSSSSSSSSSTYRRRVIVGIFTFRFVRSSSSRSFSSSSPAARLLRRIGAKVARALRFVSIRKKYSNSHKVSSSSSSSNLTRSRSLAESIDSHRAEAIEDCIEFLNSSSSLSRSNSVSTCSC